MRLPRNKPKHPNKNTQQKTPQRHPNNTEQKHELKDGKFFPPYPGWHGISHPAENDTPSTPAQEPSGEGVEQDESETVAPRQKEPRKHAFTLPIITKTPSILHKNPAPKPHQPLRHGEPDVKKRREVSFYGEFFHHKMG
jgi:hypothetical protein